MNHLIVAYILTAITETWFIVFVALVLFNFLLYLVIKKNALFYCANIMIICIFIMLVIMQMIMLSNEFNVSIIEFIKNPPSFTYLFTFLFPVIVAAIALILILYFYKLVIDGRKA